MSTAIRPAIPEDAQPILEIYRPFCEDSRVSFEICPPTPQEMSRRIGTITQQYPWLVYEHEGLILGYAYAGPHQERAAYRWSVNVAVYIRAGSHRLGIGRGLYTTLLQILRLQGYFKAYAGITLPNPGSVGLHQSLGFELAGVFRGVGYKAGAWHDVAWWQRIIQPEAKEPAEPLAVTSVQGSEGWLRAIAAGNRLINIRQTAAPEWSTKG